MLILEIAAGIVLVKLIGVIIYALLNEPDIIG